MAEQARHEYNVFVSYESSDESWVRKNVQRWLEGVGLVVLVEHRDFVPGLSRPVNITRAVRKSRHTIAVLTQHSLESEWATLQSLLAIAQDPAGYERKLIPLIVEPCSPPIWISHLVSVDLTNPTTWGEQKTRLFRAVGAEQHLVDEYNVCEAVEGLEVLCKLMDVSDIFQFVTGFSSDLRASSERFRNLSNYKAVHRRLHALQYWCHDFLVKVEQHFSDVKKKRFLDDEDILVHLMHCERTLQKANDELRELISRPTFAGCDASWIQELGLIGQELRSVVETIDRKWRGVGISPSSAVLEYPADIRRRVSGQIKNAARWLDHVIGLPMVSTNRCLREAARALRLSEFVDTMRNLYKGLEHHNTIGTDLSRFLDCIDALVGLKQQLGIRIDIQNNLQDIDSELRMCQSCLHSHRHGLEAAWKSLSQRAESMYKYSSLIDTSKLEEYSQKLDHALADPSYSQFADLFPPYRGEADFYFYKADEELNRLCEALVKIDEPLDAVVGRLGG